MKKALKISLLFFLMVLSVTNAQGQSYAVNVHVQLIQPFYPYLSDYKQKSIISFTNTTTVPMDIYLQAKLENDRGQIIKTAPNQYSRIPIHLPGLQTVVVQGFQLDTSFFDLHNLQTNLDEQTKTQLYQLGMIPEGFYTYCVTAFIIDGNGRYTPVSNPDGSCAFVNVGYLQPPQIIGPLPDDHITPNPLQNVNLIWTRPTGNLQGAALAYDLYLVKVLNGQDPALAMSNAVQYGAGIFMKQENIPATTYRFNSLTNFQLEKGSEYALMVQAKDLNGRAAFVNNGRSEVSMFTYEKESVAGSNGNDETDLPAGNGKIDVVKGRLQWAFKNSETGIIYKYTPSGDLKNNPNPPPPPASGKRPDLSKLEVTPVILVVKPFYKFNTALVVNTDPSAIFLTQKKSSAAEKIKVPENTKVTSKSRTGLEKRININDLVPLFQAFTASAADSIYSENKIIQIDTGSQRYALSKVNVTLSGIPISEPEEKKILGTATTDDDGKFVIHYLDPSYQASGDFSKLILSVQVHDFDNTVFEIPVSRGNISQQLDIGTKVLLAKTWRFFPKIDYETTDATDVKDGELHVYREISEMKDRPWLNEEGRTTGKARKQLVIDGKEVIEIASMGFHKKNSSEVQTEMVTRKSSGEGLGRIFYGGKLLVKIIPATSSYYKVTSTVTALNKSLPPNKVLVGDAIYQLRTAPSHIAGNVSLFLREQSSIPISGAAVRIMYHKEDVIEKAAGIFDKLDMEKVSKLPSPNNYTGAQLTSEYLSNANASVYAKTPPLMLSTNSKGTNGAGVNYSIHEVMGTDEEKPSPACVGCAYKIAYTDATGNYYSGNLPVLKSEKSFTVEVIKMPDDFKKFQVKNKSGSGYPATVRLGKGVSKIQDFTMNAEVVDVGGRVVDKEGKPITGARLVFKGNTLTTSGADGLFIFKLYPGNHIISLEKEGYIQKEATINIPVSGSNKNRSGDVNSKWLKLSLAEKHQATLDRIKNIPTVQSAISEGYKFSPSMFALPENNSTQSALGTTEFNASIVAAFGIFTSASQNTQYEIPRESALDVKDIGYLEKFSGKIRFTIKDKATNQPIPGAVIALFDTTHTTDADGKWFYEGFGGATVITIKPTAASGYAPEQRSMMLPENGKVQEVTILLEKGIKISGMVKSGSVPLANANVYVDDGAISSTTTDNSGQYTLVLKKGKHDLNARLQNYVGDSVVNKSMPEDGTVFNFELQGGNDKNYGTLLGFDVELSKVEKTGSEEIWSGNFIHLHPVDPSVFLLDEKLDIPFSNVRVRFDAVGNAKPVNGKVTTDVTNIPVKIYGFLPAAFTNGNVVTITDGGANKGQLKGKVAINFNAIQGYRGWKVPGDMTVMITRNGVAADNFEFMVAGTSTAPAGGSWTLVTKSGKPFDATLYGFKIHLNNNATISESGLEFSGSVATPNLTVIKSVQIGIKSFSINRSLAISGVQLETNKLPKLDIAGWEASFKNLIFNEDGFKIGGKLAFTIPSSGKSEIDFSELAIAKDEIFGGKFLIPASGVNLLSVARLNTGGTPLTFGRVGSSTVYRIGGKANLKINLSLFSKGFKIPTFEVLTNGAFNLQAPVGYSTTIGPFGFSINNMYMNTTEATPYIGIQGGFKTDLDVIKFEVAEIKVKAGPSGPTYHVEKVGLSLNVPVIEIFGQVEFKENGFEGKGSLNIPGTPVRGDVSFHYFKNASSTDLGADFYSNLPPIPIGAIVTLEGLGGGFNYKNGYFDVDINGKLSFLGTGAVVAVDKLGMKVSSPGILTGYGDVTVGTYLKTAHAETSFNGPGSTFSVQVSAQMSPLKGLLQQEVKGALVISVKPDDEYVFLGASVDVKIAGLVNNHGEMAVAVGLKNPKNHDEITAHYFQNAPEKYLGNSFSGVYAFVDAELGIPREHPLGFDLYVVSAELWCTSKFKAGLMLNFDQNAYHILFAGKFDAGIHVSVATLGLTAGVGLCYLVEGGYDDVLGWNFAAAASGHAEFELGGQSCMPGCNELNVDPKIDVWNSCAAAKICGAASIDFSFSTRDGLHLNAHAGGNDVPCF